MDQDILSFPAVKILINFVLNGEFNEEKHVWSILLPNTKKRIDLYLVWLQGKVQATLQEGVFILTDETGTVKLLGCNKLPDGCDWLKPNEYCLMVGKIRSISPDGVEIKVLKMSSLEEKSIHRQMWRREVEDLAQFLYQEPG